jgi:outer membrane biosynthesis protein TonB
MTRSFSLPVGCLAALTAIAWTDGAAAQDSSFHTQTCPVPETVRGYPVTVRGAEGEYALALANAAARRWEVPSRRRANFQGLGQVLRNRIVPPEPRWADDWFPRAQHVARLAVTLYRDGREPAVSIERPSGDRLFDRSLETIFGRSPYDHPLPPFPASLAADSLRVTVTLGEEPADSAATVRFAAQQTPVRPVASTLHVFPTRAMSSAAANARVLAVVKYDVGIDGRASHLQVLRALPPAFGEAVGEAILNASFTPAQSNCRPIAQSVVQDFEG